MIHQDSPVVPDARQVARQSVKKTAQAFHLAGTLAQTQADLNEAIQTLESTEAERDWLAHELECAAGVVRGLLITLRLVAPSMKVTDMADVMDFIARHPASFEQVAIVEVAKPQEQEENHD